MHHPPPLVCFFSGFQCSSQGNRTLCLVFCKRASAVKPPRWSSTAAQSCRTQSSPKTTRCHQDGDKEKAKSDGAWLQRINPRRGCNLLPISSTHPQIIFNSSNLAHHHTGFRRSTWMDHCCLCNLLTDITICACACVCM